MEGQVSADFCARSGFRDGPLLDIRGSHQLLISSHVRERDKALLRSVMVGGVWNGFLPGKIPCKFCGGTDGDGHLFWDCPHPPLVEIRENPEFHDLMRMDKSQWSRCLLWHGWLPFLSGVDGDSPWAVTAGEAAVNMLECSLGSYSAQVFCDWEASAGVDWDVAASRLPANPDVWTDGSLILDEISGAASAGSGVYARLRADAWEHRRWGHFDELGITLDGSAASCRGVCSVPGSSQTVQRAELWGVVLALQASDAVHVGSFDGVRALRPFELKDDGVLIGLIRKMICSWVWDGLQFPLSKVMRRRMWFGELSSGS